LDEGGASNGAAFFAARGQVAVNPGAPASRTINARIATVQERNDFEAILHKVALHLGNKP